MIEFDIHDHEVVISWLLGLPFGAALLYFLKQNNLITLQITTGRLLDISLSGPTDLTTTIGFVLYGGLIFASIIVLVQNAKFSLVWGLLLIMLGLVVYFTSSSLFLLYALSFISGFVVIIAGAVKTSVGDIFGISARGF